MTDHVVRVRGRMLSVCGDGVVANGIQADRIVLDLDGEWDGLTPVLYLGPTGSAYRVRYDGPTAIPADLLQEPGWLPVSVVGYDASGETRVTTGIADRLLAVVPSGAFDGGDPFPDQPDLLGQLVAAAERAESSADDADEAASKASLAADDANAAADRARKAADLAEDATEAANAAAERAEEAAQAAGEKSLYAYADPDNDELIILEYPAFLESEDGGSVYLTLEGSDE